MIYYFLYIKVRFRPEVVERVLRVIRHRGFILCTLNMFPRCIDSISNDKLHIYVTILSSRSIDVLCEHLNKLIDVISIIVQDSNQNYNCLNIDKHLFKS